MPLTDPARLEYMAALDAAETDSHDAWGRHVDSCPDCQRSPWACRKGLILYDEWQEAFRKASRYYHDVLSDGEREAFFATANR